MTLPSRDFRQAPPARFVPSWGRIGKCAACFLFVYILLTFPWPGWDQFYGQCFRVMARIVFHDDATRDLAFMTPGDKSPRPHDTRIEIANRALLHHDGSGPVRDLDVDARGLAWQPTALLIALIVATPLPWRRRLRALIIGLPVLHAIIFMLLAYCIWVEGAEIGLVTFTPFWKNVAGVLRDLILEQSSMAVPPLIWLLVTFKRGDRIENSCR